MKELIKIQSELKAPKGQYNKFGNYKYRSCEDILESVKPILLAHGCYLTISDDIALIGDRYYIKATATITNGTESVSVSAYARESESKKGMDASQVTGSSSSYARKYALNGLFCIDDTKDADTMDNNHKEPDIKLAGKTQRSLLESYLKKFVEANNLKAVDFISESLADPGLTNDEAEKIISRAKTQLGE